MQFPMIYVSLYTVRNSRLTWLEHMNFIKDMVARGLKHISTTKHMIPLDLLVSDTM